MTKNQLSDSDIYDDSQVPGFPFNPLIIVAPTTTLGKAAAAIASQATTTSPNDGLKHAYRISVVITITTLGSGSFSAEVSFTDDNAVAHGTCIIPVSTDAGAYATVANSASTWHGTTVINVNPNTAVTVLTAGTFTGCTYNFWAAIERLS